MCAGTILGAEDTEPCALVPRNAATAKTAAAVPIARRMRELIC